MLTCKHEFDTGYNIHILDYAHARRMKVVRTRWKDAPMLRDYNRILVTEGAGFAGGHLVEALLSLDQEVVVFDNLFAQSNVSISRAQRFAAK
jgi:hypothetical protein